VPLLPPEKETGGNEHERKNWNAGILRAPSSVLVSVVVVSAMATVIVPTANAGEQATTALLPQNQESEKSIYTMLGLEKPSREEGCQWQTYSEAKDQVDKLTRGSESKENIKKIIGYLEGKSEKIVLYYGTDGYIYGLLDSQGRVSKSKVNPLMLGSKTEHFETSCTACSVNDQSGNYSVSYELSRIELSALGSEEFSTRYLDGLRIIRTDKWVYLGVISATLYTDGTFEYDYGNRILSIEDNTYTSQGPWFDRCVFGHSTRENGYTGFVESNVIWAYNAFSPPKHSVDAWISCNIYGSTNGNSQTSDWVSVGYGCGAAP